MRIWPPFFEEAMFLNMNDLKQQKLKMWKDQAEKLELQLADVMKKRAEEAAKGDLRENGGYQILTDDAQLLSARIAQIQKMIKELENEESK